MVIEAKLTILAAVFVVFVIIGFIIYDKRKLSKKKI